MKKLISYSTVALIGLAISACSSTEPKYDKMRSADDALNKYDQNVVKDGMAITKKGAVIDIKVEEIQAQKNRLMHENEEKDRKIERLQEQIAELEKDSSRLRSFIGLPGERPKAQGKCCTPDGKMIPGTVKPAPTLDEELAGVKKNRKPKQVDEETSEEN